MPNMEGPIAGYIGFIPSSIQGDQHQDRLKPCHDRNIPLWLSRKRNQLLAKEEVEEWKMRI